MAEWIAVNVRQGPPLLHKWSRFPSQHAVREDPNHGVARGLPGPEEAKMAMKYVAFRYVKSI
jgi:hypothetical protein